MINLLTFQGNIIKPDNWKDIVIAKIKNKKLPKPVYKSIFKKGQNIPGYYQFTYKWAKECLRVAKPGATLLCFGGTRTYHRMTCAIEDAGWIIKDCIMFVHGQGFPKATDIKKSGEKAGLEMNNWNGWKSHGLKPAYEPILIAMKKNEGSYAQNALKWGVAGLNIEGGRIEINKKDHIKKYKGYSDGTYKSQYKGGTSYKYGNQIQINPQGRFPANLILECICDELKEGKEFVSGSFPEERGETAFFGLNKKRSHRVGKVIDKAIIHTNPECPCYILDKQSGKSKSSGGRIGKKDKSIIDFGLSGKYQKGDPGFGDIGGASRFFYCPKASQEERNRGLEPFTNRHPTVKSLKLMEYLCLLTKTPTGGIVLDPFAGSGTTGMAAKLTKRDYILIEKESEYVEIARARISAVSEPLF